MTVCLRCTLALGGAVMLAGPSLGQTAAPAPTPFNPQIDYYDIAGQTADELRQQMNTLGPVDKTEKKHFHALTTWHVSWHYRWERGAWGCRIISADAGLRAKIIMPRLAGGAPADLQKTWDAYVEKLLTHEKGHVAIGQAARTEAERAILALPAAATCDSLEQHANAAGNAAIRKANGDEIAYDNATRRGATQGATW